VSLVHKAADEIRFFFYISSGAKKINKLVVIGKKLTIGFAGVKAVCLFEG
jgi:hypothetical protein